MNTSKLWASSAMMLALSACATLPINESELSNAVDINSQWQASGEQMLAVQDGWLDDLAMEELSSFVAEVMRSNPNYNELLMNYYYFHFY